ncbi:MAG: alanine racemase [Candidatus Omnitrophota bacterium]
MRYYRPTWAEVDLSALDFNFRQVKRIIGKETRVMAVAKCDAYGHGLLPVAERLVRLGADYLGVASIDEAVILRKNKIKAPILILGNILGRDTGPIFDYQLSQTVSEYGLAARLNQEARRAGKVVKVHIEVDTGMGRLGVLYREAFDFVGKVNRLSNLSIEGLFTHFPCADCDPEFTRYQIEIFSQLIRDLKKNGIRVPLCHAANSMGVIGYPRSHFNLVRPGLMLYGLYPKAGLNIKLKPVMSLKTRIIHLKHMPPGQGISYGRNYITKKETSVVILPIGYGDGYPRNLSNRADVLIKGRRFMISGAICMDQIMVDVGDLRVKVGDEAIFIGSQGKNSISAEELARLSGTIPYEIVCGIGSRVPRVYLK